MRQCLAEGELRAYLDGELGAPEMERAAAHLAGCETCDAAVKELSARAERVSALLGALAADGPVDLAVSAPADPLPAGQARRPARPRRAPLWIAATAALAAGVAAAYLLGPERGGTPAAPVSPTPKAIAAAPAPVPETPVSARAQHPEVRATAARPRQRARRPKPEIDYFLALDDEPIDRGTVVRVKLGPAEVPADVVFDPEGRPRAIRLASY